MQLSSDQMLLGQLIDELSKHDTDNGRFDRSGLRLYVDRGTGIEYLSVPGGGIIRREK